ncbi:hypothetical protein GN958_ATG00167 [Phytophthora infestans]|nr:hypothetical protein GN958_ATG00167 [Phytophthora infestans]
MSLDCPYVVTLDTRAASARAAPSSDTRPPAATPLPPRALSLLGSLALSPVDDPATESAEPFSASAARRRAFARFRARTLAAVDRFLFPEVNGLRRSRLTVHHGLH